MERKKRSKGRGWESCYVKKMYGTFGVEMRAYGQKLVKFCTHTRTHSRTHARTHARTLPNLEGNGWSEKGLPIKCLVPPVPRTVVELVTCG